MSSISTLHQAWPERDSFARAVDVAERVLSAILLVTLSPVLLIVALITLVLSGRSPLIAHRRVGRYGTELWVLKFRTMWRARAGRARFSSFFTVERITDERGPELKCSGDVRVHSRFARFCRRHSLDEFPQLVHVLLGQMSLVGPRPVTRGELQRIYGPRQSEILRVKPGLAGLWQVSGRNRLTLEERCARDLECVRRRSFGFYLWVLARTIPEVLDGRDTC